MRDNRQDRGATSGGTDRGPAAGGAKRKGDLLGEYRELFMERPS